MSIQAVAWVLEKSESEKATRCVLISIANHTDRYGFDAYPSIRTIAHESRCSSATVYRSLEKLIESGDIVQHGEIKNDRGRATKIWWMPGLGFADQVEQYETDGRRTYDPNAKPLNLRGIEETPKPLKTEGITSQNKSDNLSKRETSLLTINHPEPSEREALLSEVKEILDEVPGFERASGPWIKHLDNFIDGNTDMRRSDWLSLSRYIAEIAGEVKSLGIASVKSMSPMTFFRDRILGWKQSQRWTPNVVAAIPELKMSEESKTLQWFDEPHDCEAHSPMLEKWRPANYLRAKEKGLEIRDQKENKA